jgi:hypothetical protein
VAKLDQHSSRKKADFASAYQTGNDISLYAMRFDIDAGESARREIYFRTKSAT